MAVASVKARTYPCGTRAASLVVETLKFHGVDRVFCVPGESYLALLDALHDEPSIDVVVCRHEAGAGLMALADARLTGRTGVVLVSRGPGAANAALAVHAAEQDAVPLLLIIGQVERKDLRRGSFQEIDYSGMYGQIAKSVEEVTDPDRTCEAVRRALARANAGVPGPSVLVLPEDVQSATSTVRPSAVATVRSPSPPAEAVQEAARLLAGSERPLLIVGHGLATDRGRASLLACAERHEIPVAVSFRRHDVFPNDHRLYVGDMALANPPRQLAAFRRADVVLAIGTRLGDITTQGYRFPAAAADGGPRLIHVLADERFLNMTNTAELAQACDPATFLESIASFPRRAALDTGWLAELAELRREFAAWQPRVANDGVIFGAVVDRVAGRLAPDAIVCVDAGTFAAPLYRRLQFGPVRRLIAPISGAMGLGVPAAVAATMRFPERQTLCFVGDGGLLMTGNELAAPAVRTSRLKVILSDNSCYGSIRIHQEREYPGRVVGTTLANPDFAGYAGAFGLDYLDIETDADLPRLDAALESPRPTLIRIRTSLEAVLPR